jgi:small subunit ribosomal protein S2
MRMIAMDDEKQAGDGLLVPNDMYLESGIHIGTKIRTGDAKEFVFKKRRDGIYIIDIQKTDAGIRAALEAVKKYDAKDIVVVATRVYTSNAANKLKSVLGDISVIEKRFIPGTFTNIKSSHFREPKVVIVTDPRAEREAVKEANAMGIEVIGLIDTDNVLVGIDVPVPMNNKGRKSLALFFWVLAREMSVKSGKSKSYDDFRVPVSLFERLEIGAEEGEE